MLGFLDKTTKVSHNASFPSINNAYRLRLLGVTRGVAGGSYDETNKKKLVLLICPYISDPRMSEHFYCREPFLSVKFEEF